MKKRDINTGKDGERDVVRLKNETFSAIRSAFYMLKTQLRLRGVPESQWPKAHACVEGVDQAMRVQFAQLVACTTWRIRASSARRRPSIYWRDASANEHDHAQHSAEQDGQSRRVEVAASIGLGVGSVRCCEGSYLTSRRYRQWSRVRTTTRAGVWQLGDQGRACNRGNASCVGKTWGGGSCSCSRF